MVLLHHDFLANSNLAAMHILMVLGVRLLHVTGILVVLVPLVAVVKVHHFGLLHSNLT